MTIGIAEIDAFTAEIPFNAAFDCDVAFRETLDPPVNCITLN
jgi:hypothetical protein